MGQRISSATTNKPDCRCQMFLGFISMLFARSTARTTSVSRLAAHSYVTYKERLGRLQAGEVIEQGLQLNSLHHYPHCMLLPACSRCCNERTKGPGADTYIHCCGEHDNSNDTSQCQKQVETSLSRGFRQGCQSRPRTREVGWGAC